MARISGKAAPSGKKILLIDDQNITIRSMARRSFCSGSI
jgi:hypothetical protein